MYIKIINCPRLSEHNKLWYSDKMGQVFKVDESIKFEGLYSVARKNKRSKEIKWGNIDKKDADIVFPNLLTRLKIKFGWKQ